MRYMTALMPLLHGSIGELDVGFYDELLFLSLGAVLIVVVVMSWFWSQPQEEKSEVEG